MKKKCPKCGYEVDLDVDRECPICGSLLK